MRPMFERVMTALQLTRLSVAFGAVSDLWFMIVLAWMLEGTSMDGVVTGWGVGTLMTWLPAALVAGLVVALGLFGYGASLNDVLDVRHDATFSPQRPIPAGRIRPSQAVVITVCSLVVAVLGATVLGTWSVWLTMGVAVLLLFYNTAGRYLPAVGVVTIGLIHAVHMLIPNPGLAILLPVWLTMTHGMILALGIYILEDKRPRMTAQAMLGIGVGWVFWSGMLLWLALERGVGIWPEDLSPWRLCFPAGAALICVLVVRGKCRRAPTPRAAAEKLKRYGAMWQCLYASAWFLALGMLMPGIGFAALAVIGFVVMTILREVIGLSGRRVEFR